jgi:predicted dehydrogenase
MTHRAGLVGAGGVSDLHADAYANTDGIELAAVAELDPERLAAKADAWGVPERGRYTDHAEMLAAEALDVVSVTTPTLFHREHTLDAARVGDPAVVWCEKPIATSVADAREMVAVCDETDTELVVNHVRRWAEPYRNLKALVEDGALGEVQSVNAQFKAELLRNGTHAADTIYWLLGERVERASGTLTGPADFESGPAEEMADAGGGGHLVLADDTFVTLDCTVPRESFSGWFDLTGTEGRLHVNERDQTATRRTYEGGAHVPAPVEVFPEGWSPWAPAFENVVESLVELADGTGENRCPGAEAVHVQELLVALFVSHHTDSAVTLPLAEPLSDVTVPSW